MAMQKVQVGAILAVVAVGLVLSVLSASLLMAYQTVPNTGNLIAVGVGVYWNSACTQNVTSIDWGFLSPGENKTVTVYIKNNGNVPITLNMTTTAWSPEQAQNYMALTWNREGSVLDVAALPLQTTLTLSVLSGISGIESFSFDMIITGTEQTV